MALSPRTVMSCSSARPRPIRYNIENFAPQNPTLTPNDDHRKSKAHQKVFSYVMPMNNAQYPPNIPPLQSYHQPTPSQFIPPTDATLLRLKDVEIQTLLALTRYA